MATRKTATLDPTKICMLALKQVKNVSDYYQVSSANTSEILTNSWEQLTTTEQQRITDIVNSDTPTEPQLIASELIACGNKIQLQTIKSHYGEGAVKQAWKLLSTDERSRLTSICQNQSQLPEKPQPVTEKPATYSVASETKLTKRNLIELTSNLQELDNLLDNLNGEDIPADLQLAVDDLLAQREATNEAVMEKLDNYCGLIQSRLLWAVSRKSEAERMMKLAERDQKTVDFLKARLKEHLENTDQKKLRTKRFNISVRTAGGKQSLRLNVENPKDLPDRFKRVIVEPDNQLLRQALEEGDREAGEVAYLAERSTYVAIN